MIINLADKYAARVAFWLLCAGFLGVLVLRCILAFSYIPETGGVSVNVLFGIIHLLNGHSLYGDPQMPPYAIIQYMPLHYYIVAGLSQLLGDEVNVHLVSVVNRSLCLLFDLLLFIPLQKILRNIFSIRDAKILWAVCFSVFLILPNMNYGRVDNLYLLAFMWSVYYFLCFLSMNENKYGKEIALSAMCAVLAFYTKQSGMFLLTGLFFYILFFLKDYKALLRFSLCVAGCILIFGTVLIGADINSWFLNAFKGLQNGINLSWFQQVFIETFFRKMYFFIAAGLALAIYSLAKPNDKRVRFTGFIALVVFVFALAASFKWGSSINYFTEFLVLSLILAVTFLSKFNLVHPVSKLFIFFLTPFFILNSYNDKGWNFLKDLDRSKQDYANCRLVADYLKAKTTNDEYVFTAFHRENLLNLMMAEKALFPTREIVFYCTHPMKVFSYADFTNRVWEGKVKYLVGKNDVQPDLFLDATFAGYEKDKSFGEYTVYVSKR